MKNYVLAALVLSALLGVSAHAQVKSVAAANQPGAKTTSAQSQDTTRRPRVLGQDLKPTANGKIATLQAQAKSDFGSNLETSRASNVSSVAGEGSESGSKPASSSPADNSAKTASNVKPTSTSSSGVITAAASPTQTYRVGVRDVLDIQLDELGSRNSTLFTVLPGGMLEYPLAGGPFPVLGMTTAEIAAVLRQRIKIFDSPVVAVTVRDYASHTVTVSGFVAAPGTKVLRREAVPLYAVLAEALILPEAARATITRQGRNPMVVDLRDTNLSATLVVPGDVIKVSGPAAAPIEFYFVSGEIVSPGQKPFHAGLTLTQAIIASGGTKANTGSRVKVSRQGRDGRLNTEEYNLRKIHAGKLPDPVLQIGDRIEVTNAN